MEPSSGMFGILLGAHLMPCSAAHGNGKCETLSTAFYARLPLWFHYWLGVAGGHLCSGQGRGGRERGQAACRKVWLFKTQQLRSLLTPLRVSCVFDGDFQWNVLSMPARA